MPRELVITLSVPHPRVLVNLCPTPRPPPLCPHCSGGQGWSQTEGPLGSQHHTGQCRGSEPLLPPSPPLPPPSRLSLLLAAAPPRAPLSRKEVTPGEASRLREFGLV